VPAQTKFRQWRKRRSSFPQLEKKTGYSRQWFDAIERGERQIKAPRMLLIARALHTDPRELFEGEQVDLIERLTVFTDDELRLLDVSLGGAAAGARRDRQAVAQ
jgi:transcriptional regulator with XRE-family HTH domain